MVGEVTLGVGPTVSALTPSDATARIAARGGAWQIDGAVVHEGCRPTANRRSVIAGNFFRGVWKSLTCLVVTIRSFFSRISRKLGLCDEKLAKKPDSDA
jgi:hypothetical protein